MKIVFAGTPPFAAAALRALHQAGHEIALVLTQPNRPAGRGMKLKASAVADAATALGLRIEKPATLKDHNIQMLIKEVGADIMVVAGYGLLLPQAVLDIPRHGCVNIHGSLLPRWRGAAPVQRAILAGDEKTGVCIMQMEAGLDTGPVLLMREIPIETQDTSSTLLEKLTARGAEAIVQALADFARLRPQPQSTEGITYAQKLLKPEARIDWHRSAVEIDRHIRAFDPAPGTESTFSGNTVRICKARPLTDQNRDKANPGTVLLAGPDGIMVACGEGALLVTELQKPGGKRLSAAEFLRATEIRAGHILGA
jgi:methionyl-tRNA formyltransferase